jgi:hypothetical protein
MNVSKAEQLISGGHKMLFIRKDYVFQNFSSFAFRELENGTSFSTVFLLNKCLTSCSHFILISHLDHCNADLALMRSRARCHIRLPSPDTSCKFRAT